MLIHVHARHNTRGATCCACDIIPIAGAYVALWYIFIQYGLVWVVKLIKFREGGNHHLSHRAKKIAAKKNTAIKKFRQNFT